MINRPTNILTFVFLTAYLAGSILVSLSTYQIVGGGTFSLVLLYLGGASIIIVAVIALLGSIIAMKGPNFYPRISTTVERTNWLDLHFIFSTFTVYVLPLVYGALFIVEYRTMRPFSLLAISLYGLWFEASYFAFKPISDSFRINALSMSVETGAAAFGSLAKVFLDAKDRRGLRYLEISLLMASEMLRDENLESSLLPRIQSVIALLKNTGGTLPFGPLSSLASGVEKLPAFEDFSHELQTFLANGQLSWTQTFNLIKDRSSSSRIFRYITAISLIMGAIGALLPESSRTYLVATLSQGLSQAGLEIFLALGIYLALPLAAGMIYQTILRSVSRKDIKRLVDKG